MIRKIAALLAITGALILMITGTVWAQPDNQTFVTVQEQIPVQIEMEQAEGASDTDPLAFTVILSVTKSTELDGSEVVSSSMAVQILDSDAPVEVVIAGIPTLDVSVTAEMDEVETIAVSESADESGLQTVQGTVNRNSNLRTGPGVGFDIVRSAPKGAVLEIAGENDDGTWVQVISGEWVAAFLLDGLPDDLPMAERNVLLPDSVLTNTVQDGNIPEDLEKALAEYTEEIIADPTNSLAYHNRGVAYLFLGDPDNALDDFTRAIELEPQASEAYLNRGFVYLHSDEPEKALADFTRSLEIYPNNSSAHSNRGLAYAALEDFDSALEDLDQAIRMSPREATYYKNRANVYSDLQNYEAALDDINLALELDPNKLSSYKLRGQILIDLNEIERAVTDFNKVIAADPYDAGVLVDLGIAHSLNEQWEQAILDFNKAIELEPEVPLAYAMRALARRDMENYDEALADFNMVIELDPELALAYIERGVLHFMMDNHEKALADYSKAIDLEPDNADGYFRRANLYHFRLDEPDKAEQDWGMVIDLAPSVFSAYNNRALLLTLRGEHDAALADLKVYAEQAEDGLSLGATDTRGYVYLRMGDYASAIADYESAIDDGFESVYPRLGLGIALAESGDMLQALPLLEEGLADVADYEEDDIDAQLADLIERAQTIVGDAE